MKKVVFLALLPLILSGQEESHHFRPEPGLGMRIEKKQFFIEPTVEWVNKKLHPSVEGGILWRKFDFFAGALPLRAGVNVPVWRELKVAAVAERHQRFVGITIPVKHGEVLFLTNKETVKTVYLFRFHIK